eukprot:1492131-Heterocapsa_arctica.AAC.1
MELDLNSDTTDRTVTDEELEQDQNLPTLPPMDLDGELEQFYDELEEQFADEELRTIPPTICPPPSRTVAGRGGLCEWQRLPCHRACPAHLSGRQPRPVWPTRPE